MSDFEKCKEKLNLLEIARRNSYRKVEIKKSSIADENSKNNENSNINNIINTNINSNNNNNNNRNSISNKDDNSNIIKNSNNINIKNTNKYDISSIVTPTRPKVESRKAISPSPISNQNTELDRLTPSQPKTRFHNRSEKTEHTIFHKKEIEYAAQKGIFFNLHKRLYYFRYIYFLSFFYLLVH